MRDSFLSRVSHTGVHNSKLVMSVLEDILSSDQILKSLLRIFSSPGRMPNTAFRFTAAFTFVMRRDDCASGSPLRVRSRAHAAKVVLTELATAAVMNIYSVSVRSNAILRYSTVVTCQHVLEELSLDHSFSFRLVKYCHRCWYKIAWAAAYSIEPRWINVYSVPVNVRTTEFALFAFDSFIDIMFLLAVIPTDK